MTAALVLDGLTCVFNPGTADETRALDAVNLAIAPRAV